MMAKNVTVLLFSGDVAEWLKAPHSKCGMGETPSEVQILSSPPWFIKPSSEIPLISIFYMPPAPKTAIIWACLKQFL